MEGLIPLLYKAIVQYRTSTTGQAPAPMIGSWLNDSPSASYIRLPGDSGRFQSSEIQLFQSDRVLISSSTTTAQSPLFRSNSRRLVS